MSEKTLSDHKKCITTVAAGAHVTCHGLGEDLRHVAEYAAWWTRVVTHLLDALDVFLNCRNTLRKGDVHAKLMTNGLDEATDRRPERVNATEECIVVGCDRPI